MPADPLLKRTTPMTTYKLTNPHQGRLERMPLYGLTEAGATSNRKARTALIPHGRPGPGHNAGEFRRAYWTSQCLPGPHGFSTAPLP